MTVFSEKYFIWRGYEVTLQIKNVKNLTLRIIPPGKILLSVPKYSTIKAAQEFLESKADWVTKHLVQIASQQENSPENGFDGEHIWYFGKCLRVIFKVEPVQARKAVLYQDGVVFKTAKVLTELQKQQAVQDFYQLALQQEAVRLIKEWEPKLGYFSSKLTIRTAKSRWGSCNVKTRAIMLNSRLVFRPMECLEYVVVHELAHLYEPSHGPRFKAFLDLHLPDWKARKKLLNDFSFKN